MSPPPPFSQTDGLSLFPSCYSPQIPILGFMEHPSTYLPTLMGDSLPLTLFTSYASPPISIWGFVVHPLYSPPSWMAPFFHRIFTSYYSPPISILGFVGHPLYSPSTQPSWVALSPHHPTTLHRYHLGSVVHPLYSPPSWMALPSLGFFLLLLSTDIHIGIRGAPVVLSNPHGWLSSHTLHPHGWLLFPS